MECVHIKNLEKYHPGYKDRELLWARIYFTIVQGDSAFEMIEDETDKWRFVAMICLELEAKKPLPNRPDYWAKKFNLKKRPMQLTLQVLQGFIEVVTIEEKRREENKVIEEGNRREDIMSFAAFEKAVVDLWNSFCEKHPVLTKIKEVSEKRRLKLKKRYEKESFRNFQAILSEFEKQPFLLGENERKWTAGIDWLVENDTNYVKVLEGFYMSKKSSGVDKYILPRKS